MPRLYAALLLVALFPAAPRAAAMSFDCVRGSYLTNFELTPDCNGNDVLPNGVQFPFHVNHHGIRDRDYPPHAAAGVYRILFFGSSQSVEQNGVSIAGLIEKRLAKARGGKVELINASDFGADLVRVFVSLPPLLEAYHPDAVFLVDDFQSHSLQETFEYSNAAEKDAAGLAKALGYTNYFWPAPLSWSAVLFPWAKKWLTYRGLNLILGLRMAAMQTRVSLGLWPYPVEPGRSPYLDVHLKHLEGFRSRVEAAGAKLVVLNLYPNDWDPGEIFRAAKKGKDAWYKAEHVAGRLLPWYHLKREDLAGLAAWSRDHYTYVDASAEFFSGRDMHKVYYSNDIHMNREGIQLFGERLGELLAPVMRKEPGWKGR